MGTFHFLLCPWVSFTSYTLHNMRPWDQMSCKGIEPSCGSCAYTSTGACFRVTTAEVQIRDCPKTYLEILLGITSKNKDVICSAAPVSHRGRAGTRRGWDWRGINRIFLCSTLPLDQLTCMGMLSPCHPKQQKFSGDFFVVRAEGINRRFCGEKVLSCTLGQVVKLQKPLPISSEVCLHNMQKGNKHWLS